MALVFALLLAACAEPPCGPGVACTVAGAGVSGFNGEGLPAPEAWLYLPSGLALDPDGAPCVVDFNNMRVRCLADGRLVTRAGSGVHEYSTPGAPWLQSPLENPMDATWAPDGRLTVLPVHEHRVLVDDGAGRVEVYAGTGEQGYSGDGGPAVQATFSEPCGMAWAADESLWIADTLNGAVRRVDADGIVTTVVADVPGVQRVRPGAGDEVLVVDAFGGRVLAAWPDGGTEVLAEGLEYPWSAVYGPDGALVVAEGGASRVVRIDGAAVEPVFGTGEVGDDGDGGPATAARLSWPADLLFLPDGTLLVADMQAGRVRAVGPD